MEARDAAERPTMHRIVDRTESFRPTTKKDTAENVNSAKVDKPCLNSKRSTSRSELLSKLPGD